MTRKLLYSIVICIGSMHFLSAQLPSFSLKNIEIESQQIYDGNSLWGYMNGGSDLYFEYGFEQLSVFEVKLNHKSFSFRIFEMQNAEKAFGIFSIHRFKCDNTDHNNFPVCIHNKHFQAAYGKWYISILKNDSQLLSKEEKDSFLKWITKEFEFTDIKYPSKVNLANASLICGPLGWQNGYTNWTDCFEDTNIYFWLENDKAIIQFTDNAHRKKFLTDWKVKNNCYYKTINQIRFILKPINQYYELSEL